MMMTRFWLVALVLVLLGGVAMAQETATDDEWFYAYDEAEGVLYGLQADGTSREIARNVQLPAPIIGVRVAQTLMVANVPRISEFRTLLGLLSPEAFEIVGITVFREDVVALPPPIVEPPYLAFGATYTLEDRVVEHVTLFDMNTNQQWQLIDGVPDCGIGCVVFNADNSRISYPTVQRGIGDAPRTTVRLIDFSTADEQRNFRYQWQDDGNYRFSFAATEDGAWWLMTILDVDSGEQSAILIDETGTERPLPDDGDDLLWTLAGNDLLQRTRQCVSGCEVTVYADVTGDSITYALPETAIFEADWYPVADGRWLMLARGRAYVLAEGEAAVRLLGEEWSFLRIDPALNTILMGRITPEVNDRQLVRLDTLEPIATIEDTGVVRLIVERTGDFYLLRDRNSEAAWFIDDAGDVFDLPRNLDCREMTSDGQLLCQRNQQIVRYDPANNRRTRLANGWQLVDGF